MLGKIILLSAAILAFIVFGIAPCFAQTKLTESDAVDADVSRKMKELGLPGAAPVIVSGIFALVWGVISTVVGISVLRQTVMSSAMT